MSKNIHLQRAIDEVGSQARLGELTGCSQPLIWFYLHRAKKIPASFAVAVESATNGVVKKAELSPDVFI